jgi:DNA-binding helix-hairpin-helix protein with protein kinase domain
MAMQLFEQSGRPVQLGRQLGRGGEGAVFEVIGRPESVAKLYHQPADQTKAQKLLCMALKTTVELTRLAAWPTSVLFDQSRIPRGIVMPLMTGAKEIHVLYSPAHRRTHFPKADWHFLVRAARNCAASFSILHAADVVVGDVNQGNILVDAQALVRLIDCDSFQLTAQGKVYRCTVGVSHFTPPELQSCRFENVDRTQNHDSFGLAVILFHLLFMGRHPFAGRYTGPGEMPTIEAAISQHRFAFGANAQRYQLSPPPGSPTLTIVPPGLATLFERSFAPGSERQGARPKASEWVAALEGLERTLAKCPADPGHVFATTVARCPWCILDGTSGTHFFISATLDRLSTAPTCDVDAVWSGIISVETPEQMLASITPPALPPIKARPRPSNIDDKQTIINAIGVTAIAGLGLGLIALLVGLIGIGATMLVLAMVGAATWFYLYRESPLGKERAARGAVLREAEYQWKRAAGDVYARLHDYALKSADKRAELESAKNQIAQLEQKKQRQIAQMQRDAQARQFTDYMDGFIIADAGIQGIGNMRAAVLAYHGIETARDIPDVSTLMAIQGIGDVLANSLVGWKQLLASQFQFNAAKGLPLADIQAITLRFNQERHRLESQLRMGEAELRQLTSLARTELEPLNHELARLKYQVDQAKADLRAV